MFFSISLVACGMSEAITSNNLTYEDIVKLSLEKFESDLFKPGDLEYDGNNIDYGNDLRSSSDITMWENGKYVKLIVYDREKSNYTETTRYKLKDDELENINGHPDIDFDAIEEKEPDYIEKKGEINKE